MGLPHPKWVTNHSSLPPLPHQITVNSVTSDYKAVSFPSSVSTVSLFEAWAAVAQRGS